jgi:glutamyl-tRNA synthetase
MIHGPDGEKLSKRHGAVSVMQYHEDGYLPQALLNYLARLGWSHGDDEIFSLEQFQEWFTLESCSKSAAQFDFEKLKWLNNHYLRQQSGAELAQSIAARVKEEGFSLLGGPPLASVCELLKDRASTLNELAEEIAMFYLEPPAASDQLAEKMLPGVAQAIEKFAASLPQVWEAASLSAALKTTLTEAGLKMPQVAMPLRLILMGRLETPSIDKVMALLGRDCVMRRIQASLAHYR